MSKPSLVAVSLMTVIGLGCPSETTLLPPSHEIGHASKPKKGEDAAHAAGGDHRGGVAGVVADVTAQAKAGDEKNAAVEKAAVEKAAAVEPVAGDIPAPPDVAAPPPTATKTTSGLAYQVLAKGTGTTKPAETNMVEVHYTGWTTDGKMFDSSVKRGKPAKFPLNRVIKGWTEGVQLMVQGDKMRFWIPDELAYAGKPGRPQGMLVFDVELLSIE